jgi:hypothetical protein
LTCQYEFFPVRLEKLIIAHLKLEQEITQLKQIEQQIHILNFATTLLICEIKILKKIKKCKKQH